MGQDQNPVFRARSGFPRGLWLGGSLAALALAPGSALAAQPIDFTLDPYIATIVAGGTAALAIGASLWAIAQQVAANRLRKSLRISIARARAAVGERDALITAGQEALLVWGRDGTGPFSYGGGEMMLEACLEGADATELSAALDQLGDKGASFTLTVHDKNNKRMLARGRAVGGMAAVWLREEAVMTAAIPEAPFREMLDALPLPVWLRDKTLALRWANRAYIDATDAGDLEGLRARQPALEKSERDLAAAARTSGAASETRRYTTIGGQRRALNIVETPLDGGGVAGSAIDHSDVAAAETKMRQYADAQDDTLNRLTTAVAIFGADQRLTFFNKAFAQLWDLPERWLKQRPTDGEILDRLRDFGKLPEHRDYQQWKRDRLRYYEQRSEAPGEDTWHLPGGKALRIVAQPHPLGGLTYLYEDVSERIALESSYNTLSRVQSATLNTLQEGVAVFGNDGRLKLYNAAFARIWELTPKDLGSEPHIRSLAATATAKFGNDEEWEALIGAVVAGSTEPQGEMERNDHSILALELSTLPDGAMLVTFADVTDRSRIEHALRERNEALVASDKLKTDFVQHASFLFRDPLNVVRGFADMLNQGVAGPLSDKQAGYVQNILTASEKLEEVTSDILDLALIDAGAMRLELSRVDLYALLNDMAEQHKTLAESRNIELIVDCPRDVGMIVADARRLKQIAFNLLSNAFDATPPEGKITLGGSINGDEAQIWVTDTGSGMTPELQATAFDRFEAARTKSGQKRGAGLGLALVSRFVELHDGWVEIQSRPDKGTTVRCHLPRRIYDQPGDERKFG